MPNANYLKGRNFEYKVKKSLEDDGYFVVRTAGSHSPIDLLAFKRDDIRMLQLKCKAKPTAAEIKVMRKVMNQINSSVIKFYMVYTPKRGMIMYRRMEELIEREKGEDANDRFG